MKSEQSVESTFCMSSELTFPPPVIESGYFALGRLIRVAGEVLAQ